MIKDLSYVEQNEANKFTVIQGKRWLSSVLVNGELTLPQQREAMKRIVDCVNAMADIEDPLKHRETWDAIQHLELDAYHKAKEQIDELTDWKKQAEIGHEMLMTSIKNQQKEFLNIIEGLLDDFKYYIADNEEPPVRAGYIKESENFIQKLKNQKV